MKHHPYHNHLLQLLDAGMSLGHYFTADIWSASDYYPFGMGMGGRSWQAGEYRFTFQGQEEDTELWGGAVSYKYRVEDKRLGRFFSVDPLAPEYPWNSSYAFSENKVIQFVELEGLETGPPLSAQTHMAKVSGLSTTRAAKILNFTDPIGKYINSVKGLTEPERAFIQENRFAAYKARDNEGLARNFARNARLSRDPINPNWNDEADAVRHALWSALNTQTSGEEFAREIGIAHEDGVPNGPEERKMDLLNNEIGIQLGLDNPDASALELTELLIDMAANGELSVIDPESEKLKKSKVNGDIDRKKSDLNALYSNGESYEDRYEK
jgi:RHS repeat-associated protein